MRHQNKTKKLSRPRPHRKAMLANLATSLFAHRTIETTHAKATELRRLADRLITIAKKDNLAARREVARTIHDKAVHKKLFTEIIPTLQDRNSGYTRVIKKMVRRGDAAIISIVELLTPKKEPAEESGGKGKKKSKSSKSKVSETTANADEKKSSAGKAA